MSHYTVLISAGTPRDYSRKVGWDGLHATRDSAEEVAKRAESNDGWSAKVVPVTADEAAHWRETIDQRLARQQQELMASLPSVDRIIASRPYR